VGGREGDPRRRGPHVGLSKQIGIVGAYFDPRNVAAHASIAFYPAGFELGMVRLNRRRSEPAELVKVADLEAELRRVELASCD
jgi:hypothetical protein